MLGPLFALIGFLGGPLLASSALGQTALAQPPIACELKDNVEGAECRNKLKELFTRKGDTLILNLDGGESKTYVSNLAACDGKNADPSKCTIFRVLSYFPQTQSYLIEKAFYECGVYLFVSRHSGSETVLNTIPVLSPGAKYLLSIDQSDACERKYDIAIWSLETSTPKLEFNYRAKHYENWEITAWENDTHFKMKAWVNSKRSYDQEAELLRTASGWSLILGRKTDRPR